MADDQFNPQPYVSFHGDEAVTNYHQCMNCDTMLSGPEKGQKPAQVERTMPLPEGVSPFQANRVTYGPEGSRYQADAHREDANISHFLCKDCNEAHMANLRRQHDELVAQREREARDERERRKAQRRFKRGRKDTTE